jgi:hypothetical protein
MVRLSKSDKALEHFLHKLLTYLPEARKLFYARGFLLPKMFLAAIEGMRKRDEYEYEYDYDYDY